MQSYRVVTSSTPEGLSEAVERLLNEGGYYLQGGVSVCGNPFDNFGAGNAYFYAQALCRMELSEHAKNMVEAEAVA